MSIVIPTFNRDAFLKQCLESLAGQIQTSADIEIRVIDDASPRQCSEKNSILCKEYGVQYELLKVNKGAPGARNAGIARSRGEWIVLLDDDVRVDENWLKNCREVLSKQSESVLGVEGKVVATGKGLWDREVENLHGGLYLSCHIYYRRVALVSVLGFDENFKSRYPSGEDHELAARVLCLGDIVFEPQLCVKHLPRLIRWRPYVIDVVYRMQSLLYGDLYFNCKHRDKYHLFRFANSFWGTYKNIALKHLWVTLRRRSRSLLMSNPGQLALLITSCVLEQCVAIALLPWCYLKYKGFPHLFFLPSIDLDRTKRLWKLPDNAGINLFKLKQSNVKSIVFPLTHKPAHSIYPLLQNLSIKSDLDKVRVFLRIDDVFFENNKDVEFLCRTLKQKNIPFCAAIKGDDLNKKNSEDLVRLVCDSGGEIALHGFSHVGKFGPFFSEILQCKIPQLKKMLYSVFENKLLREKINIFIPPFNALNREQIVFLTHYFKIICCGPEAGRFTDYLIGPMALRGGSWFFPAYYPFYDNAANILRSKALDNLNALKGYLCVGVHMTEEAKDGYKGLTKLLDRISESTTSWEYLYDK